MGPRRARSSCAFLMEAASRARRALRSTGCRGGTAEEKEVGAGLVVLPFVVGRDRIVKLEMCEIGRMRYEPLGKVVEVVAEGAGEVLIATRFVIGSAVKSVPSILEEAGAMVVMRILDPIALLSAVSSETVFAAG